MPGRLRLRCRGRTLALIGLLLCAPSSLAAQGTPALEDLPSYDRVQRTLPGNERLQLQEGEARVRRGGRRAAERSSAPSSGTDSTKTILSILGLIALTLVLVAVVSEWRRNGWKKRSRKPVAEPVAAGEDAAPPAKVAPPPLPDHAQLANEERFAEAIHAVFLLGLSRVTPQHGASPALTSRELLRSLALPAAVAPSLRKLGNLSDGIWFGGRTPDAAGYATAVELLARLGPLP